ncbi:3-phosphoshikimate 1-carboxyvinyltransferase [Propionibacteriaceae bacterium G1746]|uniref:3-phosphoshikimate 1-carboxyvinyltransferase n=1 Tax=Aestuariimicrobium sp. G57 TaxID=3418485 RepID=UPI003C19CC60
MTNWSAPFIGAGDAIDASVVVPGSKSETNRALLLAALADGPSTITGGLSSRDADLMRAALAQLGVTIIDEDGAWRVTPPAVFAVPDAPIDCGLAGTVMRFVPPLAALNGGRTTFTGDAHASARPMGGVLDGLAQLGVAIDAPNIPFTQDASGGLSGRRVEIDSSGSSQFVSALLLSGARYPDGVEVVHVPAEAGASVPSRPHIDMTVQMLRDRGVEVSTPDEVTWQVAPGAIRAVDQQVEPDLTSAAAFLAAAALTGGVVRVPGWPVETTQGGAAIADILRRVGAEVSLDDVGGGHGTLVVRGTGTVRGIGAVDLHASSELTPVVAAVAAVADGRTVIQGVAHIRGHETDRLAALVAELGAVGAAIRETADGLEIEGRGAGVLKPALLKAYADHRMAHAAAVVGLVVDGVELDDIACTTKTIADFPGMWSALVTRSGAHG